MHRYYSNRRKERRGRGGAMQEKSERDPERGEERGEREGEGDRECEERVREEGLL